MNVNVWVVAESFALRNDWGVDDSSMDAYADVFGSKKEAIAGLRRTVQARVLENYEGNDEFDDDELSGEVDSIIKSIKDIGPEGDPVLACTWSSGDRVLAWKVYKTKVRL